MTLFRGALRRRFVRRSLSWRMAHYRPLDPIRLLIVGGSLGRDPESEFQALLGDLDRSVRTTQMLLSESRTASTAKDRAILPYAARSLLELSANIFVARLDPFRVLALRKCQLGGAYALGTRAGMAMSWMGDVYTKDGAKPSWNPDKQAHSLSRALLDNPWSELAWHPAFEKSKDMISGERGKWMAELRSLPVEEFVPAARGRLLSIYSALSKGVHHELVIPTESLLDGLTLRSECADLIKWLAYLGFVSSFIGHAASRMSPPSAMRLLQAAQMQEGAL